MHAYSRFVFFWACARARVTMPFNFSKAQAITGASDALTEAKNGLKMCKKLKHQSPTE